MAGEQAGRLSHKIHRGDISKHRKDVFRLYRIIDPPHRRATFQADMRRFLNEARGEPIDLRSIGITQSSFDEVLEQLGRIYGAARELLAAKVRGAAEAVHASRDSLNLPLCPPRGQGAPTPIDGSMGGRSRFQ